MSDSLQKEYELKAVFSQDKDCTSSSKDEDYQFLEVWHEDGGGGPFFIIKTKRWAFDKVEDLCKLLKEFEEKLKTIQ